MRAFWGKLMFSNILQRKIPSFEELSVNIFLMHNYARKNVLDPVLFMSYHTKLSNKTAHKCAQISNSQFFGILLKTQNGNFVLLQAAASKGRKDSLERHILVILNLIPLVHKQGVPIKSFQGSGQH